MLSEPVWAPQTFVSEIRAQNCTRFSITHVALSASLKAPMLVPVVACTVLSPAAKSQVHLSRVLYSSIFRLRVNREFVLYTTVVSRYVVSLFSYYVIRILQGVPRLELICVPE